MAGTNLLPHITRFGAVIRFVDLRLQIQQLAKAAAALPVPAHYRAQAETLAALAGLRLHHVVGDPDRADALALRDDLEALWRVIDPLVKAIGAEADCVLPGGIDLSLFEAQLQGALEGNATYVLTQAAEAIAAGDHRGIAAE